MTTADRMPAALEGLDTPQGPELVRDTLAESIGGAAALAVFPAVANLLADAWSHCPECDPGAELFGGLTDVSAMLADTSAPGDAESLIFEAVGAASMCWENVDRAGAFDSDSAATIARKLVEDLRLTPGAELTSVDQLEAASNMTVIVDRHGCIFQRVDGHWYAPGVSYRAELGALLVEGPLVVVRHG